MNEYYFAVNGDGIATVLVVSADGSYSVHTSDDATLADGDGAIGPYPWTDAHKWDRTTREHASTMMQFEFPEEESGE